MVHCSSQRGYLPERSLAISTAPGISLATQAFSKISSREDILAGVCREFWYRSELIAKVDEAAETLELGGLVYLA